ncbi:hypothetical protein TSAR_000454 [Trichomalopsis sarcophagae]|uniref:AB hydrolase-1 domain-containing protein n=1 Tax=Trichomalopsis sarcophagae TaxID=543379 RepID=A0A232F5D6_9HYME|nr:hypothetical protein TSAR_000454 [Trichomalopsis sarcophagae]
MKKAGRTLDEKQKRKRPEHQGRDVYPAASENLDEAPMPFPRESCDTVHADTEAHRLSNCSCRDMAISTKALSLLLFPALAALWKFTSPLIAEILPLYKEVVHLHPGSGIQIDNATQYAILDFIGLVEQHGYSAEEHNVTTSDGYILRLHRISGAPTRPKAPGKPVVYLQHGIGLSSDSWVLIGPRTDLAFLLVDAGYDVWMGNVRGNTYSRAHVSKDPNSESYWSFSYHEIALYDISAFIDAILDKTGAPNLTYFGYSMGTTLSYALLSTFPEYNDKINMVYSAAPVVFWGFELQKLVKFLDVIFDPLKEFIAYFNFRGLLPQTAVSAEIGKTFCGDESTLTQPLCAKAFCNIGLDCDRFNKTALPSIMAHYPAGMSTLTVYHYNQNYKKNTFQAYDYGGLENMIKYGQPEPPYYNLTKVTVPVSIWYAEGDDIVNPKDALALAKALPNLVSVNAVEYEKFNHFDFLWAKDVKQLFYDKLPVIKDL